MKQKNCGHIAYVEKVPIGFIEYVPGIIAQNLGVKIAHPPDETCYILCLSVGFGSKSVISSDCPDEVVAGDF